MEKSRVHLNQIRKERIPNSDKFKYRSSQFFSLALFLLFIAINSTSLAQAYEFTKNNRERSIEFTVRQQWLHETEHKFWERDQFIFYISSTGEFDSKDEIPLENYVYQWGECIPRLSYNRNVFEETQGHYIKHLDNPTELYVDFKWYNVPEEYNGWNLYITGDNDRDLDQDCADWDNFNDYYTTISFNDYFKLSTSAEYESSAENPDYVIIKYSISNTESRTESAASYTVICRNGAGEEVGRNTNKNEDGEFYVPVSDPTKSETFTIEMSTSLSINNNDVPHSASKTVSVSKAYAPSLNTPIVSACEAAVFLNLTSSSTYGSVIERCENSGFSGGSFISTEIGTGTAYSDTDNLEHGKTYYYRARRWGAVYSSVKEVYADFTPTQPTTPSVTPVSTGIQLDWNYSCDNVTEFIIKRKEKGTGGEIELARIESNEESFTDFDAQSCVEYAYKLVAVNSQEVENESEFTDYYHYSLDISNAISNLNVSKGYSPVQTDISWSVRGNLDEFLVLRKEYGSSETSKQILSIEGRSSSSNDLREYQLNDNSGSPNVIYEYTIKGILVCADTSTNSNSPSDIGFRTATGDFYGRVAFESGQGVDKVAIVLESSEGIKGKSLYLNGSQSATVSDSSFLNDNLDSLTIQAWIAPEELISKSSIAKKEGITEVFIENDKLNFKLGSTTLATSSNLSNYLSQATFIHVSCVYSQDSLAIYINGSKTDVTAIASAPITNDNPFVLGENFVGAIDEVRIWDRPLGNEEISDDYQRYLTGGEEGLLAYWTFNFATSNAFYDGSFQGQNYNENHGVLNNGALISDAVLPTDGQLSFKGITAPDGSYSIRAVPYIGNGTAYNVIARKGIHTFEPVKEVRFLGDGSQNHTVNFTDKSSFEVSGYVTYAGGTMPVEGVSFQIDGVSALSKSGNFVLTDSKGEFAIEVPVGVHEVKAVKQNHVFENEGKITYSNGQNRNYQDDVSNVQLVDATTVRYIGRVAGGTVQEAYPLGHSLSKNNLADSVKVILKIKNPAYEISSNEVIKENTHKVPSNQKAEDWTNSNEVKYTKEEIIIDVNPLTGEFVADVIPESFTVNVVVPGHDDLPGSGEDVNFSQKFVLETAVYEYLDSVEVDGEYVVSNYSDTSYFNYGQKFIKRYSPKLSIEQLDGKTPVSFFGDTSFVYTSLDGENDTIYTYNNGTYLLNLPVFTQNKEYNFEGRVFEEYAYYNSNGVVVVSKGTDEVPTQDAKIEFNNGLTAINAASIDVDSLGSAKYTFSVGDPEMNSGKRNFSAKVSFGEGSTTVNWDGAFEAIVLGSVQTGLDFITAGPDKVLSVLRDPPGSNSYSFLEKGISFNESSEYNWNVNNEGTIAASQYLGFKIQTWVGVGAGVVNTIDQQFGVTVGLQHQETLSGNNSSESVTTTTTNFQTSSNSNYVGADGDVYIGYSTNITYGETNSLNIISKEKYAAAGADKFIVYEDITPIGSENLLVQENGIGFAQSFGTMFAYPQSHIVTRLLPEMIDLKNSLLMNIDEFTEETLQQIANDNDTTLYVSYLSSDHEHYGKDNSDPSLNGLNNGDPDVITNGPSYRIYFSENDSTRNDTILYLNQSINRWEEQLALNEKAKLNATLLQNYSFQAGSPVSFSEAYSFTESVSTSFSFMLGLTLAKELGIRVNGAGLKITVDEAINTTHSWSGSSGSTISNSKGFVLEDDGVDYLTVDVLREKGSDVTTPGESGDDVNYSGDFHTSFVFRTKAGATSCPYEGENVTKYFQPGQHILDEATKRIEIPEISVENDFIENIPSGGAANFKLYLRNNSEIKKDNWFKLKIVEQSNSNGAMMFVDGAAIGSGRDILVPAEGTLVKTLRVEKGDVMNYDDLKLILQSSCEYNVTDTVSFSVHYIPSCSDVAITSPSDNWTYNTRMPVRDFDGVKKHYMTVNIGEFDVNYNSFHHIKLQYKSSAQSDQEWTTLMKYFTDSTLYKVALESGNASIINASDAGSLKYEFFMDDLPDQRYDLRAVSVCMINNEEVENESLIHSGIKDMYNPRLFGAALPANGILTIEDEARLNFNEQIAEGYLTQNNFQVTGIRNGAVTDHSVSISFDGQNDFMQTEVEKNLTDKDVTMELWARVSSLQDATLFSHGNVNESLELAITADKHVQVTVGSQTITSENIVELEVGTWAHLALEYDKEGYVSAFFNFSEVIHKAPVSSYTGIGSFVLGQTIDKNGNSFKGEIDDARVWNNLISSAKLQVNSLVKLSGNEVGLLAYYPINEAKGTKTEDKARGASMILNGCLWANPAGRAISFNGANSSLQLNTGSSAVITSDMDYTIEFWFAAEPGQTNTTMLSNGKGDGTDLGGSNNLFSLGFNANGLLSFTNNGYTAILENDYRDNNWHHLAISTNRTIGRTQIVIDGNVQTFFDSEELGGIEGAYMYLGALSWYNEGDALNRNEDQFFSGKIDELRIWNLYKNEELVQHGNTSKLDGNEMGLLAYYPFEYYAEWQGTKELNFTLMDQKIQADPANVVPDAINTNAEETSVIPPVKDRGPVSNLKYDFVVNNDALIITLEEPLYRIEKTIITFTANGVRDVNGNLIISPITWTAYIDRNQLKWSESRVAVSSESKEPATFTVQASNKGGTIQNFTIDNLPSWLTVSPSKGAIAPNSDVDITFAIDKGLNIGTYNEIVYIKNDEDVSEPLELTVLINGNSPSWEVNPADFKYNMSLFGKMRFNNIYSSDQRDVIGAFKDGQCIGMINSVYNADLDAWYVMMTVYGNETTFEDIEFRMWDASTGLSYVGETEESITFINNAVYGSLDNLVIFDADEHLFQNIELTKGWNWVSYNVESTQLNSVDAALAYMNWSSSDFFKSEQDNISANYSELDGVWVSENDITLNNKTMYKVSSSVSQTMSISGNRITPSTNSIEVKAGQWNYIAYTPMVRMTLDEALAGYNAVEKDVLKTQNGFAIYSTNFGWVGSLSYMEPNAGYMLLRNGTEAVSFTYPDNTGSLTLRIAESDQFVSSLYATNMSIIANSDVELLEGDVIHAYVNDELASSVVVNTLMKEALAFITLSAQSSSDIYFALERNGVVMANTNTSNLYRADAVVGDQEHPFVLQFDAQVTNTNIVIYPQPADDKFTLQLMQSDMNDIEIEIADIAGRVVQFVKFDEQGINSFETTIDCGELSPGTYIVSVTVDGIRTVKKIEII